ncbi:MAG: DUF2254 domain-containing protein [Thermomicrobiales bacterium]
MEGRIRAWWYGLQDSLWFIPSLCTAAAVLLALLTVQIDQSIGTQRGASTEFIFGAGPSGARQVLGVIAGTMITVTGVVFSITIVALQLASSQFTPRVLRAFTGDPANQIVLGVFIATFTYALLVLRTIREAPSEDAQAFIPHLSVTVAVVLALVSIGFLIFYINHASHSIQASVIIDRASGDTRRLVESLYPDDIGRPVNFAPVEAAAPELSPAPIEARSSGYIQAIDADALFSLSEEKEVTIRLEHRLGDFVLSGARLASIWPAERADDDVEKQVHHRIILGHERTLQSDLELGFRQLADIGIKALSLGINDPTTAIMCIDRLAEALIILARRREPSAVRTGEDGQARLILPRPHFARMVDVAYTQMRHYGVGDVIVAEHLMTTLGQLARLTPANRREPLLTAAHGLLEAAREQLTIATDVERVETASRWMATYDSAGVSAVAAGQRDAAARGGDDWRFSGSGWSGSTPRTGRNSFSRLPSFS